MIRLLAFLALLMVSATAQAETRALIVASTYEAANNPNIELANPHADALLMQAALRKTSVDEVTVLTEPDAAQWEAGFTAFAESLDADDIAIFYFAGHGFQVNGQNYFLTSDGKGLIGLNTLMQQLTERARGAIVVIDACRSNPFAMSEDTSQIRTVEVTDGLTRNLVELSVEDLAVAGNGLAQLGNLRGLSAIVFFSTEPGNVAEDGDTPGLGSPFAKVFSEQIARRQSLDEAFRRTAVEVNSQTDGRQSPWRQGDLPFNVFIAGMRALPIP